mgnify:CR=1 FL=1
MAKQEKKSLGYISSIDLETSQSQVKKLAAIL